MHVYYQTHKSTASSQSIHSKKKTIATNFKTFMCIILMWPHQKIGHKKRFSDCTIVPPPSPISFNPIPPYEVGGVGGGKGQPLNSPF